MAFSRKDRLGGGLSAGHPSERRRRREPSSAGDTAHVGQTNYGLFLDFVARSNKLDQEAEAGGHVTPELVEPFVEELKRRVSSVTVYGSIQKLRRFTQLMAPKRDLGWLIEIERELFSAMRPKSKWDRVVLAEVVIEAGLTLIAES